MKMPKLMMGLTAINLVLLLVTVAQAKSTPAPEVLPIVRTQAFELVDQNGQVRSRLNVETDGTVVFRLLDEEGTIRVKLGADKKGSGLVLLDETTEPGVHIVAREKSGGIKLRGINGRQRVIEP
jgi:hypothetical protein